jgi:hypothetical protein
MARRCAIHSPCPAGTGHVDARRTLGQGAAAPSFAALSQRVLGAPMQSAERPIEPASREASVALGSGEGRSHTEYAGAACQAQGGPAKGKSAQSRTVRASLDRGRGLRHRRHRDLCMGAHLAGSRPRWRMGGSRAFHRSVARSGGASRSTCGAARIGYPFRIALKKCPALCGFATLTDRLRQPPASSNTARRPDIFGVLGAE